MKTSIRKRACFILLLTIGGLFASGCALVPQWTYTQSEGWSGPEWVPQERSDNEQFRDEYGRAPNNRK